MKNKIEFYRFLFEFNNYTHKSLNQFILVNKNNYLYKVKK